MEEGGEGHIASDLYATNVLFFFSPCQLRLLCTFGMDVSSHLKPTTVLCGKEFSVPYILSALSPLSASDIYRSETAYSVFES